jgi:hypothetical protein
MGHIVDSHVLRQTGVCPLSLQVIQLAEDMVAAAAAGQGTLSQQPKAAGPTRALAHKNHARAAVVVPAADIAAAVDAGLAAVAADGDASEVVGEHPDYRALRLASFAVTGEHERSCNSTEQLSLC